MANSERRKYKQPSFSPLMFVISAEGGGDEQLSEAEKIAGSDFSRAKRARRARIRDDTRKSRINTRPAEMNY